MTHVYIPSIKAPLYFTWKKEANNKISFLCFKKKLLGTHISIHRQTSKRTNLTIFLKVLIYEKISWGVSESESEAFLFSYGFF